MDRSTFRVRDPAFVSTKALPGGAGTVYTDGLDLGPLTARGARLAGCELVIQAPALTTEELPDTETLTYSIQVDADSEWGSPENLAKAVLVQTGAGGAGAAAAAARIKIPSDCLQHVRVAATNSGAGDCSGQELTAGLRF